MPTADFIGRSDFNKDTAAFRSFVIICIALIYYIADSIRAEPTTGLRLAGTVQIFAQIIDTVRIFFLVQEK